MKAPITFGGNMYNPAAHLSHDVLGSISRDKLGGSACGQLMLKCGQLLLKGTEVYTLLPII